MARSRSKLHRHRSRIAAAIEAGTPYAEIARRRGVGVDAVREYVARYLPELATPGDLRKVERQRERGRERTRMVQAYRAQTQTERAA